MGNIGSSEILLIFVLALLLLGPKRLPEVGEMLGRTLRRFRQASRELRDELDVKRDLDLRQDLDLRKELDLGRDIEGAPRVSRAREAQPREARPPVEPADRTPENG